MRCALVLFSNAAFKGIFRVQVLESAGIDRFCHLMFRQQTWQESKLRSVVVVGLQMWESRERFPSLALVPGVICRPSGCVHLWHCWEVISLSFKQNRPSDARHPVGECHGRHLRALAGCEVD